MALEWGVTPILIPEAANFDELLQRSLQAARESGLVDEGGGRVVIAAGTHVNLPGTTDLIKVDVL
jgi:pyruvate kinase